MPPSSGDAFEAETLIAQVDRLIMSAIQASTGPQEAEMVGHLLRLRDSLGAHESHAERQDEMTGITAAALGAVNDYFERMLRAMPEIEAYLEDVARRAP